MFVLIVLSIIRSIDVYCSRNLSYIYFFKILLYRRAFPIPRLVDISIDSGDWEDGW